MSTMAQFFNIKIDTDKPLLRSYGCSVLLYSLIIFSIMYIDT